MLTSVVKVTNPHCLRHLLADMLMLSKCWYRKEHFLTNVIHMMSHLYIKHQQEDVLTLQQGANVNQQNVDGDTSLCIASRNRHLHVVEYLVQNGAHVNRCNKDKESPLCLAAQSFISQLKIVQYLVNKGANVNHCSESNKSPLYWASDGGHLEVVEFLEQNGADVNKCSKYIDSPLYQASQMENFNVVEFLVENGDDLTVRDGHSLSLLEKTRQCIIQNKYFEWKIDDRKKSMQFLKKYMRRNSI